MQGVDWRELYAANQAIIAHAGIPTIDTPGGSIPIKLPNGMAGNGSALRDQSRRSGSGSRALRHIPRGLDRSVPRAVVCMLHGCSQGPASFAAATAMNDAADRHGFVVAYPGQVRASNPQRCWNWFLPQHQQRCGGEPAAIAEFLRDLIETEPRCTIDPARVFVAGLSSGAAMALVLTSCYPDLIAAVAIHSGLPYRCADDLSSALQLMAHANASAAADGHSIHDTMGQYARPIPSLVIHGNADRTVNPANARRVLGQTMHANHLAAPETCNHHIAHPDTSRSSQSPGGLAYTQSRWTDATGALMHELIEIDGLAHAWSGGTPGGSYTDPRGPSATEAIWTFFSLTTRSTPPTRATS